MRVLDLGSHDGFLSCWLVRQFPERRFVVHGCDLNPEAVRQAQRRLEGEPNVDEARFEVARAEDTDGLFGAGYDAVVCFELLEHVPDPDRLLASAERLAGDRGVVFVSTPDGTFGAGANPHHLRCWTAPQLADTLRRRGRLLDLEAGPDGVTVASYRPGPRRGRCTIHTGSAWERWGFEDVTERGLGGSETAACRLAHELAELGWVVTVYGGVREGMFREVAYVDERKWDPDEPVDLLVASRVPELADSGAAAKVRLLWLHDVDCGPRLTPERAEWFDRVLVLSRWHERHVKKTYPYLRGKLERIRNGVHLSYFDPSRPWEDRDPLLVYTSSPDRGLDVMLDLWPEVEDGCAARGVDAVFAFCYAGVYDAVAAQRPDVAEFRARVKVRVAELEAEGRRVDQLPAQPHPQLAALLGWARVWAHPSWQAAGGPFMETSCIGAVEAQAAGCRVVASGWGALPETVRVGELVGRGRRPSVGKRWRREFVEACVRGLCEDAGAVEEGPAAVAGLGWAPVAERVDALALSSR